MYERMLDKQNKPAFDDMLRTAAKVWSCLSESTSGCQIHAALKVTGDYFSLWNKYVGQFRPRKKKKLI